MVRIKPRYAWAVALMLSCACGGCAGNRSCDELACRDDAAITVEVRSLLNAHPALNPNSLYVQTRDHVVYLYGLVDTEMERRSAESIALGAKGAVQVVNLMGVNNGGW
ncbi:MAG: BON domain-containing protein [Steroidobacterales bacterium]